MCVQMRDEQGTNMYGDTGHHRGERNGQEEKKKKVQGCIKRKFLNIFPMQTKWIERIRPAFHSLSLSLSSFFFALAPSNFFFFFSTKKQKANRPENFQHQKPFHFVKRQTLLEWRLVPVLLLFPQPDGFLHMEKKKKKLSLYSYSTRFIEPISNKATQPYSYMYPFLHYLVLCNLFSLLSLSQLTYLFMMH